MRAVVVAFDPLQLDSARSDSKFEDVVRRHRSRTFALDECYRQKRNVGEATERVIDVVAASTPYLSEEKILDFQERHSRLTELSNGLKFTNPLEIRERVYGARHHVTCENLQNLASLYEDWGETDKAGQGGFTSLPECRADYRKVYSGAMGTLKKARNSAQPLTCFEDEGSLK